MTKKTDSVIKIVILVILVYLVITTFTSTGVDKEYLKSIDSLNNNIKSVEKKQESLTQDIKNFELQVSDIDNKINSIKNQKTIIKEYFHEKIISVDGFSRNEIDSFFSKRYGYTP